MASQPLRRSWLLAIAVMAAMAAPVQACPMCSQALADGKGGDLIAGFFWSIVFMMSMPFLIVAALALYFYLQVRKARAAQAAAHAMAIGPGVTAARGESEPAENELIEV